MWLSGAWHKAFKSFRVWLGFYYFSSCSDKVSWQKQFREERTCLSSQFWVMGFETAGHSMSAVKSRKKWIHACFPYLARFLLSSQSAHRSRDWCHPQWAGCFHIIVKAVQQTYPQPIIHRWLTLSQDNLDYVKLKIKINHSWRQNRDYFSLKTIIIHMREVYMHLNMRLGLWTWVQMERYAFQSESKSTEKRISTWVR